MASDSIFGQLYHSLCEYVLRKEDLRHIYIVVKKINIKMKNGPCHHNVNGIVQVS